MDRALFPDGRSFIRTLHGKIGLNRKQAGEGAALLIGELAAETILTHDGLTLSRWHLAEIAKGAGHEPAAVIRKPAVLFERATKLLPLRLSKVFHRLGVLQYAAALLRSHVIELGKTIPHGLLRLGRQVAEAGLTLECALLFCQREVAVTVHPLLQVFLIWLLRTWCTHRRAPRLPRPPDKGRLSRNHRRCCRQ